MSKEIIIDETPTESTLVNHELKRIDETIEYIKEVNKKYKFLDTTKDNDGFNDFIKSYTEIERDRLSGALTNDVAYKSETIDGMRDMLSGIKALNRFISISALNLSDNNEQILNLLARRKGITDGSIVLSDGQ